MGQERIHAYSWLRLVGVESFGPLEQKASFPPSVLPAAAVATGLVAVTAEQRLLESRVESKVRANSTDGEI